MRCVAATAGFHRQGLIDKDSLNNDLLTKSCQPVISARMNKLVKKILKKMLKEFRVGVAQALVLSPGRAYTLPGEGGFRTDAANMRQDVARLGDDMKNNFKRQNSNGNPAKR